MVTRDILYLTIDTFLDVVVKRNFALLSVGWYLFRMVAGNRYLPRGSNGNTLSITKTSNVFVARWVIRMSFRENSIALLNFVLLRLQCLTSLISHLWCRTDASLVLNQYWEKTVKTTFAASHWYSTGGYVFADNITLGVQDNCKTDLVDLQCNISGKL